MIWLLTIIVAIGCLVTGQYTPAAICLAAIIVAREIEDLAAKL